jgi:hypothetical protein
MFSSHIIFQSPGKSIDNSLTQNYQPLEYENPASMPKFLSRGQSYRAVIGDTIVLPCVTQDLGEDVNENGEVKHVFAVRRFFSVVAYRNLVVKAIKIDVDLIRHNLRLMLH